MEKRVLRDVKLVHNYLTESTGRLPNVIVVNGRVLNHMLETDEYDIHTAYVVSDEGISILED